MKKIKNNKKMKKTQEKKRMRRVNFKW